MKKLLKFALIVGGIAAVAKVVAAKKGEWHGLTEAQVRDKLSNRLPDRMPAEKQAAVADKVVAKMRERGVLTEDETAEPETAEPEAADTEAEAEDTQAEPEDTEAD